MITQIRIPLCESSDENSYNTRYRKLSQPAQRAITLMAKAYQRAGTSTFDLNDFRSIGFGAWRAIRDVFYELESRQLGQVKPSRVGVEFEAFLPVLQSIGVR